ncbi:hypothetical protein Lal_00042939 [Lupinus albus]|nr:hypothetical protein Lal_00042939 [Lupinus albus]
MKSVVHARSKNMKLIVIWNSRGQPCNNKGGKTLVSYIGVLVRQNVSIKFKHWSDERLNAVKYIIWKDITVNPRLSERFSLERERDSPRRVKYWAILEDPRLSERFSPGRERLTWEGEILEYTGRFSPERELSRLGEK